MSFHCNHTWYRHVYYVHTLFSDKMRILYPSFRMDQLSNNSLVLAKLERNKEDLKLQLDEIRANREEMEKRFMWQKERLSKIKREKDQLKAQLMKLPTHVDSTSDGEHAV